MGPYFRINNIPYKYEKDIKVFDRWPERFKQEPLHAEWIRLNCISKRIVDTPEAKLYKVYRNFDCLPTCDDLS